MKTERESCTVLDAAGRLECTPRWVLEMYKKGKLEGYRLTPRKTFIFIDSLESLIHESNHHNQR